MRKASKSKIPLFCNSEGNGKNNPESVSGTGATPKVN